MSSQSAVDAADEDFYAADRCAINHYPGHEAYAVEHYLRCLCLLAFAALEHQWDLVPREGRADPDSGV